MSTNPSPPRIGAPGTDAPARCPRRRAGYTLVQLMIVVVVASVSILFITGILLNTQNAFSTGVTVETAQANAVRLASETAAELKDAILSSVYTCSYCKNHISFQKNRGHDPITGAVLPSSWIYYWYQWNYTGSPGAVGEGQIVRWQDGYMTTLGQSVKSTNAVTGLPGFCITRNGSTLTVSVTVEMTDRQNKKVSYTASTSVCPQTQ